MTQPDSSGEQPYEVVPMEAGLTEGVVVDEHPEPIAGDSPTGDVVNFIRGFCMGAADTVPGVSGGTVALVLGHYQRLLTAISHFDTKAVGFLRQAQYRRLRVHCDLRFLSVLFIGLLIGAVSLGGVMRWLLENRMPQTFAVFFGLVLASSWIVLRWIRRWNREVVTGLVAGVVFAYWVAGLRAGDAGTLGIYLFFSASVAICAMILPGISGAFVLLLLGMYHPVIAMIDQVRRGDITGELLMNLGLFAAGCAAGLAAFSRLLRWLLKHHMNVTMAVLVGLMLGSLRRVWPLQQATEATAGLPLKERIYETVPLAEWDGNPLAMLLPALAAAIAVIVIERVAAQALPGHDESGVNRPSD